MTAMQIVRDLPRLQWRGLDAPPYDVVTAEFAHDQSARGVPYVDGEIHDWTGRKSFKFTVRLFFLNGLINEPNHFPDTWNDWRDALLDGSADTLVHPILGPVLACVDGGKFEVRSSVANGIIVDASFSESLDDPAGPQGLIVPSVDPGALALAADTSAAVFGVTFPSGKGFTSLLDAWNAIKSGLFSASLTLTGQLNQIMGITASMIDAIDVKNTAAAIAAYDNLIAFWTSLKNTSDKVASANRPTAKKVLRQDTTLDAFADTVGNTLVEIMGLNLQALRLPSVSRGTTLTYYTSR